jgi:hypothetical protein
MYTGVLPVVGVATLLDSLGIFFPDISNKT